jgi:hypothetical protein
MGEVSIGRYELALRTPIAGAKCQLTVGGE